MLSLTTFINLLQMVPLSVYQILLPKFLSVIWGPIGAVADNHLHMSSSWNRDTPQMPQVFSIALKMCKGWFFNTLNSTSTPDLVSDHSRHKRFNIWCQFNHFEQYNIEYYPLSSVFTMANKVWRSCSGQVMAHIIGLITCASTRQCLGRATLTILWHARAKKTQ